jgi:tetratricopeptide (TPR) repeat protein
MKAKLYLIILLAVTTLYSCKTAKKMYAKGQYEQAVSLAAKELAKKPGDLALQDIILNAYQYAIEDHETRINAQLLSQSDLRYEKIYGEYQDLQRLYNAIKKYPAAYQLVNPTDYSSFITTYKDQAGNAREQRGDQLMNQQTKTGYKNAYYEFQKALSLKPNDITIKQKMEEAYANAVTHVVIRPVVRYGYQYSSFNYDYQNFDYDLLRYVQQNNRGQFLAFHNSADPYAVVDNTVDLRFSDINIGRYRDQRSTRDVSKQIVAKEIVHKKDSVTYEYITVRAKITTTTRTLQADGLLQASIMDQSNRRIWSNTYTGDYRWMTTITTYTGDERALSDNDKKLINQRPEFAPSNDEIIRLIMNELRHKTACGISDYYNARY